MVATYLGYNLWIGDQTAAKNLQFLKDAKIKTIINCSKHIPDYYPQYFNYHRISVNDPGPSKNFNIDNTIMLAGLLDIVDLIHNEISKGNVVFVHCHAGAQRSACVCTAYLAKHVFGCVRKSIKHLREKRKLAFNYGTSINFYPALYSFAVMHVYS